MTGPNKKREKDKPQPGGMPVGQTTVTASARSDRDNKTATNEEKGRGQGDP